MVHSGYEASAVNHTFSSFSGFLAAAKATLFTRHRDPEALTMLDEPSGDLVQIALREKEEVGV
jgi:hypothetical protein